MCRVPRCAGPPRHAAQYASLLRPTCYTDLTLRAVAGATTYPQIFIGGRHIGGADDLETWLDRRKAA